MSRTPPRRALAATFLVGVLVLATACGESGSDSAEDPTSSAASGTSSVPTSPSASDRVSPSVTPSVLPSATPTTTGRVQVPVYFVGPTPRGPRLFAELVDVDADHAVDQALAALAAGPMDPDYATYLRTGALRMESYDESAVLVVPDAQWATRPDGMTDRQARLALQQVVLTVQASVGEQIPVGFVTPDHATTGGFFGLTSPPGQNGYVAARGVSALGLVNVLSPAQGRTVTGSFRASGTAMSFEGTVAWRVLDASGHKVLEYSAQQRRSYLHRLAPWQATVDVSSLAPGRYTFVASTDSGDPEGPDPDQDSKAITVS